MKTKELLDLPEKYGFRMQIAWPFTRMGFFNERILQAHDFRLLKKSFEIEVDSINLCRDYQIDPGHYRFWYKRSLSLPKKAWNTVYEDGDFSEEEYLWHDHVPFIPLRVLENKLSDHSFGRESFYTHTPDFSLEVLSNLNCDKRELSVSGQICGKKAVKQVKSILGFELDLQTPQSYPSLRTKNDEFYIIKETIFPYKEKKLKQIITDIIKIK